MRVPFRKIRITQRTRDSLFDLSILLTSLLTIFLSIAALIPIIILLPEFWLRPFVELCILAYLGFRGLLLWRREVQ